LQINSGKRCDLAQYPQTAPPS